jgi:hypothetical protein
LKEKHPHTQREYKRGNWVKKRGTNRETYYDKRERERRGKNKTGERVKGKNGRVKCVRE